MDMQIPSTSAAGNNVETIGELSKNSVCECVVCALIIKGFSTLNFTQKLLLITKGRPTPAMKNLTTKMKNCVRHFYPEKTYEQFKWLTGCENISKLFCWPCLLFENEKGLWNKSGFSDLNNFHKAVKRHVMSKAHLQAVLKEKVFGQTRIDHALNKQIEISHRQHNELVDKNRKILKRFIDVVCFLGQHELGFRGHDETMFSSNRGNFQDLISLMAKYDDCLKNHLEQSSVFRGTSNRIQNDLISAVATIILKRIKQEIDEARFIAIVLDETTDITNFSQLSIVIRYVKSDGSIQERFLGFKNVSENRTADALYSLVYNVIKDINGEKKLVAQSYDGAAVMAGQLGGLQAKVRETFPSALFVHCFAHKLNLVLSQSINHIKECKVFFVTLSGMAAFFSKSTKRTQALDTIVHKRLPKVAPTRWNYNGRLVLTVFENRESLIELFENIIENNETWDSETINSSRGFLDCLKRDFNFNYLLIIFSEIFPFSDNVFNVLQTKTNDIAFCLKKVDNFKSMLSQKRDEFNVFWEKTKVLNVEPQAKRPRTASVGDVQASYRRLFYEIIDQIQQQINHRFNGLNDFKFLELCNFTAFKGRAFPEDAFKSLLLHYGHFFDRVLLRSELKVIYETDDINTKNNSNELLQFFKDKELEDAYTEVFKLCELVLTIPATSSSVERNFSTLKRIKNFVRNSTGQERLSQISLLSIENELLQNMSEHRRFYDDVIDEFAKSDRRIELHYK